MDGWSGGVCAGFAQEYGWDVTIVRLVTVVLFFAGCGSMLIAYIAAWMIMPNEPLFYGGYASASAGWADGLRCNGWSGCDERTCIVRDEFATSVCV